MNEIAKPSPAVVPGLQGRPAEPQIGTVLVYRVQHDAVTSDPTRSRLGDGPAQTHHYASIRAANGRWYTTGSHVAQGVDWYMLSEALQASGAEVHAATGWAAFEL